MFVVRKSLLVTGLAGIGAAVLLVAAVGASGSPVPAPRVTQRAIAAPHASGVDLTQVVCRTRAGCVAVGAAPHRGTLVLGERGSKWSVQASFADVSVSATPCLYGYGSCAPVLSCPTIGNCVAVGWSPLGRPSGSSLLSQSGRSWSSAQPQFPPQLGNAGLTTISCVSAGNCTAVGASQLGFSTNVPQLLSVRDGAWGVGTQAQLPPDAATTSDPDGFVLGGGSLSVVSCPAATECVAAGSYGEKVAGEYGPVWLAEPWLTTEQAGQWQPGVKVQLPPDAVNGSGHANDPFIGFTGSSCPSVGNCTLVGGYDGAGEQGLILTERNGVWLPAIPAPQPKGHKPPNWPNELDNPLGAVACADANDCAAIGALGGYAAGPWLGWLLSERHGTWTASTATVALPSGKTGIPINVFLRSIACPSAGNCVAVGTYQNGKYGLILIERNGKWRPGIRPLAPRNAARKKGWTTLESVSCPSTNQCTIVGQYNKGRSGDPQGLIINLGLH